MFLVKSQTGRSEFIYPAIIACTLITGTFSFFCNAEMQTPPSKRVEVYSLTQNDWDTQYGDTLSKISLQCLPNNPIKRAQLEQDIILLNPGAFINADPAFLLAGKRLRMPGYMKQVDTRTSPASTIVESFSWGSIKRPR